MYGAVSLVVWEGISRKAALYPDCFNSKQKSERFGSNAIGFIDFHSFRMFLKKNMVRKKEIFIFPIDFFLRFWFNRVLDLIVQHLSTPN